MTEATALPIANPPLSTDKAVLFDDTGLGKAATLGTISDMVYALIGSRPIDAAVFKDTRDVLYGDLAHGDGAIAVVTSDSNNTYRGWYKKSGASGVGAWAKFDDLASTVASALLGQGMVSCSDGSPNYYTVRVSPVANFTITGTNQLFVWTIAAPNNGTAPYTFRVGTAFGDVDKPLRLPNGAEIPRNHMVAGQTGAARYKAATDTFELLWPAYVPQPARVRLNHTGGTYGRTPVFELAHVGTKVPADVMGVIFEATMTSDRDAGSGSAAITGVIGTTSFFDIDGVTPAPAGAWKSGDTIEFERQSPVGAFRLLRRPDSVTDKVTGLAKRRAFHLPTKALPIIIRRASDKWFEIISHNISYDRETYRMRQDFTRTLIEDIGPAMSQGLLKSPHSFAINSMEANVGGRDFRYLNLASTDIGGGNTSGATRSTLEPVERLGRMTDTDINAVYNGNPNDPKHAITGLSHVQMRFDSGSVKIAGDATDYKAAAVGWEKDTSWVEFTQVYSAYLPSVNNPVDKCGLMEYVTRIDNLGVTVDYRAKIGRSLSYISGSSKPAEGAVITGATSGATATVVCVPDSDVTGTWGAGTAAGKMFLSNVVGTFQAAEELRISAVTVAVCNSAIGPQVSSQNTYVMLPTTTVDIGKPNGQNPVRLGAESGEQQPAVRALNFNNAFIEPVVGDLVEGATSGARGSVWALPAIGSTLGAEVPGINASGSWMTGTRAGRLQLADVAGGFQAGEVLLLNGVAFATATSNSTAAISYGDGAPSGTWAAASRAQAWHTRMHRSGEPKVILEAILLDPVTGLEAPVPSTPPGDFSYATTSKLSIQDRSEGVRKFYFNMRSGAAPLLMEGQYRTKIRYRYRVGEPV